jgi:tRNA 2-thiouridine synthesizing protein D
MDEPHDSQLRLKRRLAMANFLFVLSRDHNEAATRCFQFAKIAHSKGHQTDVFFIDDGVRWADSGRDVKVKTPTGDCPNDYLPYLVDNQVPIGV